ncbi:YggS family pyridoxal phosphate-dependent enzyme, partial [Alloprevotella tannerae]|uniref:YggS family pyridoxal phosphate-dependent enzyme n=1 Tax=Alloprevotella tannerae TaxID=76122 RepID=UPI0028E39B82
EAAYNEGQRVFGESHEQELRIKQKELPKDIAWHFIGHLQANKVKYIAPYISMIEAVDTFRLLKEINKHAAKYNRVIDCLLEIHIAQEETKYGFTPEACRQLLADGEWRALKHIRLRGLMCMATNTDDTSQIRREFQLALQLFEELKSTYFSDEDYFNVKSWGMTHDYKLAIEEGSNHVRVGTAIFGARTY